MHKRIAAGAIALSIFALAPAAAQDQFAITPPTGWSQTNGPSAALGVWVSPDAAVFRQNLNLVSEPFDGTLAQYVAANRSVLAQQENALKFGPQADAKTCGSHPAHFISWEATMLGHDLLFEQMLSVWNGRGYVFTYTREWGQPELDAARASLTTLCIRQV